MGEFALIDEGRRSATVRAQTDVLLLKWDRSCFHRALTDNPDVAQGLFRVLTAKLREDIRIQVDFALEKERWRQDLQRAREIQTGMLPEADFCTEKLQVSGFCRPAVEVGGDYYDYISRSDEKLGIIICDVTGHGFYSSLFVAMAKSCLHTLAEIGNTPDSVMLSMRNTLSLSIQRRLLMSCCYALIDPVRGTLLYANAGHPFPYHYCASTGSLERLGALDPILGALEPNSSHYQYSEASWAPGDLLVLYTDGITEERDSNGKQFGHERLEKLILEHANHTSAGLKQIILDSVADHVGDMAQRDDMTLVVAKAISVGDR